VFRAGGPLALGLNDYEPREGQVAVAKAVERALAEDGILICEAGTGIGKTLAYLVPALLSGRKVVISTATRTLQEQIFHRDLPLVQALLGTNVPAVLMKGLSNYLCRRRHAEHVLESMHHAGDGPGSELEELGLWTLRTRSGDLNELSSFAEDTPLRRRVASGTDTRIGPGCPYFDDCFVTQMRKDAQAAQLVVVNHHLFFADLALRGPHPGHVLPDYDAVILDEAHRIEDVAAGFFGSRVRSSSVERWLAEVQTKLARAGEDAGRAAGSLVERARTAQRGFFARIAASCAPGRSEFDGASLGREERALYFELDDLLSDLGSVLVDRAASDVGRDGDRAGSEALLQLSRRGEGIREQLQATLEPKASHVAFVEVGSGEVSLGTTPVDLGPILAPKLLDVVPSVALLSATLCSEGQGDTASFAYVRQRLGVEPSGRLIELSVPSPFEFEKQCLLYLPRDLPAPGDAEFLDQASERVRELIGLTGGGAFVLTTSLASMRGFATRLGPRPLGLNLLVQGQGPKEALLDEFRSDRDAVLVATASFWEGVDVPGDALRLVILEKIPFAVPTDPLVRARGTLLEEQGKNAFSHLAVPEAAIALKQGFGRLIRHRQDRGVVALLDGRVQSKGYGRRLLAALPPASRTDELERVRAFVHSWPPGPNGTSRA